MSRIVVFGVTGYAGGHITAELLDRGHTVVGVARDTTKAPIREGLELRPGSLYDPVSRAQAIKGADTIVVALPALSFGSWAPGEKTGKFRLGTDILVTDASGNSEISGADYATAFADEIENPAHHQARFTIGY
jgi:putative NADH-flavin reductase